jgi:hypothetical protein
VLAEQARVIQFTQDERGFLGDAVEVQRAIDTRHRFQPGLSLLAPLAKLPMLFHDRLSFRRAPSQRPFGALRFAVEIFRAFACHPAKAARLLFARGFSPGREGLPHVNELASLFVAEFGQLDGHEPS